MVKYYDTLLGEYIKNPGKRGLYLDKLAENIFDYQMISYDEITFKKKKDFIDVDLKYASIYSGEDVYITNKLYNKQKKENIVNNKILQEIELPLIEVLKNIEISGVKIDSGKLKSIGEILKGEIKTLKEEIFHESGETFNINSPKQVGEILFEKLGLPKGKKTKIGYSVSAEILGELQKEFPIAQMIVSFRHYNKILSTYVNGLLDIISKNKLIHTSYNQSITSTGRLSSSTPNLQNIPSSDGIAGMIREAFISRFDNGRIIAFDYSQVEIRILAIMSGDENLLNAFKSGTDIHHKTAEFIFGKSTISSSERKIAKAVNFGVIYGISAFGLSKMIDISIPDAKIYINKFFENYKKVKIFLDEIVKKCEETGHVETLFNRKRYIPGINDKNKIKKKSAMREAINMPIQGTSADIIKIAMIKIDNFIKRKGLKSKMIMQVHDELVFDVTLEEKKLLEKEVLNIMENIISNYDIKLKVDIGEGINWREAK